MQIKKLLLYGILLTLIPFSAKAIQLSIDELRGLFSGQEQDLGATVCYPYQGCTGKGTATASDVGKYLKVSGYNPFTYSFDTPAGGSGDGGGSSIWSTTTPMTIYYNQEGYPLVIGNNATSSDGTIFEIAGNSYFNGDLELTGSYYGIKDEMVKMDTLAGATYTTQEDWWNVTQSAGKINSGGELSDNGDGTITITAGEGIFKTTDSSTGDNVSADMPENSSLGISQNEINYIYADYNGGSPIFATTTSRASINGRTKVPIGMAYNDGTQIHILSGGVQIQDLAFRTHRRAEELYSFIRASGLIVSEIGTRGLTMTSGVFYRGNTRFTSTASSSITFTTWYNDGVWQKTTGQTTISNTQYNDYGTGLATIAPNKYGVYYIYRDFDGDFYLVYGIGSYTLAEAKALGSPDNLPDLVSSFSMLLAKVIVKRNDTNFTEIQIPWEVQFSGQTATSYDDLSDLPDLTVYAELAQNDTITGNWVNTTNPWANDEVSDDLTVNGYMQDTDIDTFAELQSWVSGYTDNDTQLSQEQVEDYVGGMTSGTETHITVTYDDTNGNLDYVVSDDWYNNLADLQGAVSNDFHNLGGTDANTEYTAGGTLLDLTGTTFSLKEGTLTDTKYCTYETASGIVCNSEGGSSEWTDGGLFLYPNETSDVVVMGGNATTTTGYILETIGDILTDGLTVDDGSTSDTTVLELGADTNIGCIKMRDSDRAGWSYLTILNGVLTASVNSCE